MAKMRVVIYLCGDDDGKLDDAEKQCSEHAEKFGWQVLEVIRHKAETTGDLSQLMMKVSRLRAQMIVTDTLDMLSPDTGIRDRFMEAIERQQCIVHPVNMPPKRLAEGVQGDAAGREMSQQGSAQRWTAVLDGERLRQLRQQHGLSQEKLADLAGMSLSTVARLERQDRSPCRSWTLGRLAAALNETPAAIAPGGDIERATPTSALSQAPPPSPQIAPAVGLAGSRG
jgi:DNA-binding XRE family transcriptional regulator